MGLSAKTVKSWIERLDQARALVLAPSLNLRALKGMIGGDLLVEYGSPGRNLDTEAEVVSILDDRLIRSGTDQQPDYAFFPLMLTNISEAKEVVDAVKRMRRVRRVCLDIAEERIEIYDVIWERLIEDLRRVVTPFSPNARR